jgi:hypothetical protein
MKDIALRGGFIVPVAGLTECVVSVQVQPSMWSTCADVRFFLKVAAEHPTRSMGRSLFDLDTGNSDIGFHVRAINAALRAAGVGIVHTRRPHKIASRDGRLLYDRNYVEYDVEFPVCSS